MSFGVVALAIAFLAMADQLPQYVSNGRSARRGHLLGAAGLLFLSLAARPFGPWLGLSPTGTMVVAALGTLLVGLGLVVAWVVPAPR
ncbi:hypothetical protein [Limnochorda pilosa]|uniref:Uncharacterized protein n=1 Tax=Limnochorda pilosa TaxID=1555112 RepID=A0A0K2SFQ1_LIMPI|nr:hypothetical protein [Limnochorda pilosa]BAS25920.1 hypothetical protein LIP_0063 [Limnochorda pilosa]